MSNSDNKKIAVIAQLNARENIEKLTKEYYLWVLDSEENKLAIEGLDVEYSSFPLYEGYSVTDYIECYIETIIEHHPNWEKLLLVGAYNIKEIEPLLSSCNSFHVVKNTRGLEVLFK